MATPWQLVVSSLDGSTPPREASVEADNWLAALRAGRHSLSEEGGVPAGASCTMSAAGDVTIVDGKAGLRYELRKLGPRSMPPQRPAPGPGGAAPVSPPVRAVGATAGAAPDSTAAKPGKRSATVAYSAEEAAKMRAELMANAPVVPGGAPPPAAPSARTPAAEPPEAPRPQAPRPPAQAPRPPAQPPVASPPQPAPPAARPPEPAEEPDPASNEAALPLSQRRSSRKQTVAYLHNPLGSVPPSPTGDAGPPPRPAPRAPAPPSRPPPPAAEAQVPESPAPAPDAPAKEAKPAQPAARPPRARQKTVAYMEAPLPPPPTRDDAGPPAPQAPAGGQPPSAAPPPPAPIPPMRPPSAAPPPPLAEPTAASGPVLLHSRDEEPTEERPLVYRERAFAVDPETDPVACEWLLREQLAKVRATLDLERSGNFVSIALFDHHWSGRPSKPPIATLQWKDWRGEPEIKVSGAASNAWRAPSKAPPPASLPPGATQPQVAPPEAPAPASPPAAPSRPSAPTPRPADDTGEHDRRLAYAFEAAQDLYFLETAGEGVGFTVRLLQELIPCEVARGTLYDINSDELRVVAQIGPGGETPKGPASLPGHRGLFAIAVASGLNVWVSADLQADPRFKPEIDGTEGVEPHNAAFIVLRDKETLLGVVQLLNRVDERGFTESDKAIATYAAEQLKGFLRERRVLRDE